MTSTIKFGDAISSGLSTRRVLLNYTDTGDNNLGTALPSNSEVVMVTADIKTTFNGTGNALKVGDAGDDDRFMLLNNGNMGEQMLFYIRKHHIYSTTTQMIVNLANTGGTQGQVEIVIEYIAP